MKKVCFLEEMVELVTVFGFQGVWDADVAGTGLFALSLATCVQFKFAFYLAKVIR